MMTLISSSAMMVHECEQIYRGNQLTRISFLASSTSMSPAFANRRQIFALCNDIPPPTRAGSRQNRTCSRYAQIIAEVMQCCLSRSRSTQRNISPCSTRGIDGYPHTCTLLRPPPAWWLQMGIRCLGACTGANILPPVLVLRMWARLQTLGYSDYMCGGGPSGTQ